MGENSGTLGALRRRISQLQRFGFMSEHSTGGSAVRQVLEHLQDNRHVVLGIRELTATTSRPTCWWRTSSHGASTPSTASAPRRRLPRASPSRYATPHHHRGGAPLPRPRRRGANHIRHDRAGDEEVPRHAARGGPATIRHRRRGAEPGGHPHRLPVGQRPRRRRGADRRTWFPGAQDGALAAGVAAAVAHVRARAADAGGRADAGLRRSILRGHERARDTAPRRVRPPLHRGAICSAETAPMAFLSMLFTVIRNPALPRAVRVRTRRVLPLPDDTRHRMGRGGRAAGGQRRSWR